MDGFTTIICPTGRPVRYVNYIKKAPVMVDVFTSKNECDQMSCFHVHLYDRKYGYYNDR